MALNGCSSSHSNYINRIALNYNVDKHNLHLNGYKLITSGVDEEVNLMTAGNIIDLCHIRDTGQRLTIYNSICVHNITFLCKYVNMFVI